MTIGHVERNSLFPLLSQAEQTQSSDDTLEFYHPIWGFLNSLP